MFRRAGRWLLARSPFDSLERVSFDFAYYFRLRDGGMSHGEAVRELDRLWSVRV